MASRQEQMQSSPPHRPGLDDGCFDHPVLVLHTYPKQESCTILIVSTYDKFRYQYSPFFCLYHSFPGPSGTYNLIANIRRPIHNSGSQKCWPFLNSSYKLTTLGGKSLAEKWAHNPYFRHVHLPIFPCAPHPDHGIQLFLEDGLRLRRESYVKTEWRYFGVGWNLLAPYDDSGRCSRLHAVSYQDLVRYIHTPFVYQTPPGSSSTLPVADEGESNPGASALLVKADKVNHHTARISDSKFP